jgi:hypothetical protein
VRGYTIPGRTATRRQHTKSLIIVIVTEITCLSSTFSFQLIYTTSLSPILLYNTSPLSSSSDLDRSRPSSSFDLLAFPTYVIVTLPRRTSDLKMISRPWLTCSPNVSRGSITQSRQTSGLSVYHSTRSHISDSPFLRKESRHMSHRLNCFRISLRHPYQQ